MKTTLILDDHLIERAKKIARKRQVSLTAFMQEALYEHVRAEAKNEKTKSPLNIKPFGEGGLVDTGLEGNWRHLRELAYER